MLSKKYNSYFFLKNREILAPVIANNDKKARKLLIAQHKFVNATGKEHLVFVRKFETHYSITL